MNINDLVGCILESCSFSRGSYTFEFSGFKDDQFRTFKVSTSYLLSLSNAPKKDIREKFSASIWIFLERKIIGVHVNESEDTPEVTFAFEGGGEFVIWENKPLMDNLLIVTESETGAWFPVL